MFVGALKLDLQILGSRSLKEKRMVLRRIKDRVRERLGLVVAEVGNHELWQRAELGIAVTSGDRSKVMKLLDEVGSYIASAESVELLAQWREVSSFDGELDAGVRASEAIDRYDDADADADADADYEADEEGRAGDAGDVDSSTDMTGASGGGGVRALGTADGRSGRRGGSESGGGTGRRQANNGAQWTPPEWQRILDEESR